jgi:hypothetical protein
LIHKFDPPNNFEAFPAKEAVRRIREIRNQLLEESVDKINGVRWAAMTAEQQAAWTTYRKALLDITLGGTPIFPSKVVWPTKPE